MQQVHRLRGGCLRRGAAGILGARTTGARTGTVARVTAARRNLGGLTRVNKSLGGTTFRALLDPRTLVALGALVRKTASWWTAEDCHKAAS